MVMKQGRVANLLTPEVRNNMGELYLDNVERVVARESANRLSIASRPARRFVADPDIRQRCTSCGRPARRPRVVAGNTCCTAHNPADAEPGAAGELMAVLQDWFGHQSVEA